MARNLPLTDLACKNLKPGAKALGDGGSLSLVISPTGVKSWQYRYRIAGRPGIFTIGQYPAVSLAEAREARDLARAAVVSGTHPKLARQRQVAERIEADGNTVAHFVAAWLAEQRAIPPGEPGRWTPEYGHRLGLRVQRWIVGPIGEWPVADVSPAMCLDALKQAPASMRRSLLGVLDSAFTVAIEARACRDNPAAQIAKRVHAPRVTHLPAASSLVEARAVLAAVEADHRCHAATILAHRLIALTGLRINEATRLRWDYVQDLTGDSPTLVIPAEAMKGRHRGHSVPLAPQAVAVILQARRVGLGPYVFAAEGGHGQAVAAKTVQGMLKRTALPVRHVAHGWRAAFSTIMNEAYPGDRAVIDLMLHHVPNGMSAVEGAYNRSQHHDRRRVLAGLWADMLLEGARPIGEVIGGVVEVERRAA
jgi:integrase